MIQDFRPRFQIESSKTEITSNPGFAFLVMVAEKLGTSANLREQLKPTGNAQDYNPLVYILSLAALLACGGTAVSDISAFRNDKGLLRLLGLKSIPADNSIEEWLRKDSVRKMEILQKEITHLSVTEINRKKLKRIILDPDVTLFERYNSECKMTYKGFKGYAPMVVLEALTRTLFYTEFREGNESPASRALEVLDACLINVPKDIEVFLRVDSAWYNSDVFNRCDEKGVKFTISVKFDSAVNKAIEIIPATHWRPLSDSPGYEITETVHATEKSNNAHRLIVIRWESDKPQLDIFEKYKYHAVISNMEESAEEVLSFHRGRGADEKINDELKNGYEAKRVPCQDFNANAVYWMIACLALNLMECAKVGLPVTWHSFRIKKLRFRMLNVGVRIIKTGRQLIMQVQNGWPWYRELCQYWRWCFT